MTQEVSVLAPPKPKPIPKPSHYCYEHDQDRRQGRTSQWGHILPKQADDDENSYCIEGREGWRIFDANQ